MQLAQVSRDWRSNKQVFPRQDLAATTDDKAPPWIQPTRPVPFSPFDQNTPLSKASTMAHKRRNNAKDDDCDKCHGPVDPVGAH